MKKQLSAGLADLLAAALAKGLKPEKDLKPGKHQLRGTAIVTLDCWLEKAAHGQQKRNWPAKAILAFALLEAARMLWGGKEGVLDPEGFEELAGLLDGAAGHVLAREDWDSLDQLGPLLEQTQKKFADQLPTVPRAGTTSLTGEIQLIDFKEGVIKAA